MPVAVLTILKFCLLALIFLFLARVLRAVWAEIDAPLGGQPAPGRSSDDATEAARVATARSSSRSTESRRSGRRRADGRRSATSDSEGFCLTVVEPVEQRGQLYPLDTEMTIGRAPGCAIVVTDSFASQLHARVFDRDGDWFIEDLGSRNGTWLNRTQVHGPSPLHAGDRIKVGDTVLQVGPREGRS